VIEQTTIDITVHKDDILVGLEIMSWRAGEWKNHFRGGQLVGAAEKKGKSA
jgi:hypothetical protein